MWTFKWQNKIWSFYEVAATGRLTYNICKGKIAAENTKLARIICNWMCIKVEIHQDLIRFCCKSPIDNFLMEKNKSLVNLSPVKSEKNDHSGCWASIGYIIMPCNAAEIQIPNELSNQMVTSKWDGGWFSIRTPFQIK